MWLYNVPSNGTVQHCKQLIFAFIREMQTLYILYICIYCIYVYTVYMYILYMYILYICICCIYEVRASQLAQA